MEKKDIVVIGYPKSGNTWATRLVAELVGCHVVGFWNSDHPEIAVEGSDRKSDFSCYKSHHQLSELTQINETSTKMIYVIRDPRDICVSGAHYFNHVSPIPSKSRNIAIRFVNKLHWELAGKRRMIQEMAKALLVGNERIHHWCRVSWKAHVTPFLDRDDVLLIQYDRLLKNPMEQSKRILKFLDLERSESEIDRVVDTHNFEKSQKRFADSGNSEKKQFLRKGGSGEWRHELTSQQKRNFESEIGELLTRFGYDLS